MRLSVLTGLALATTFLAACTSSNTRDTLNIAPSSETVASIVPPAPIEDVAGVIDQEALNPYPVAQTTQPQPFVAQAPVVAKSLPAVISKPASKPAPIKVASVKPESPARAVARKTVYSQKFRDAKPVKFAASRHPKKFEVHGVDVSRWQYDIDWKTLRKQGANFAFIKATEGGDHLDPMFMKNWKGAKAAGIPRGAYHFMYWCRSGEAQAKWFIRNVPKEKGMLPPVVDAEWNHDSKNCRGKPSPAKIRARMKYVMDAMEAHYGVKPIIYTAPDFYEDNLQGHFKNYSFWLRSVAEHPSGRYPNRSGFAFWQYSGTGLSKGVNTQIDLNVFNGTEASWNRWLAKRVVR